MLPPSEQNCVARNLSEGREIDKWTLEHEKKDEPMKLTTTTQVSVDGVMGRNPPTAPTW
jgi:hypothetical protein